VPSTVEKLSPTRVKLTVEIPFADLKPHLDKAYKEIAEQVSIPGFRKGKVPAVVIDQRFGRGVVLQEAINEAIQPAYEAAMVEAKAVPLAQPEIEITKLEDGELVEFTAEVDIRPEFDLPDFTAIETTVDALPSLDEEVEERIALLRKRFATTTELVSIRRTIPGKAIRDGLGIAPSTPVHEVVRRRSVDSHPVSLHRSFVPVHLAPELEHDDVLGEQLCVILENKYGLRSSYTGEQLEAVAATKEEADLLGLRPGAPLLLLQDTISEASGRVFEFSKILFRGDRIKLHFDYRS